MIQIARQNAILIDSANSTNLDRQAHLKELVHGFYTNVYRPSENKWLTDEPLINQADFTNMFFTESILDVTEKGFKDRSKTFEAIS